MPFYKIYVPPQALCDTHSISEILPLPPHTVNPPGSQSHRSFSHLPIMQASWRWNGSRRKESTRYELWDSPNHGVYLLLETDKSEGKSCVALQCWNFPHHTLLASESLSSPFARNHFKRVVSNYKSFFRPSLFQTMHKSEPLFSLKAVHCVGFRCRSLHGGWGESKSNLRGKASSSGPVVRPWKSHTLIVSHMSWRKHTLSVMVFTSPAARKAIIAAHVITCVIWNNFSKIGFITWSERPAEHCIHSNGLAHNSLFIQHICVFFPFGCNITYCIISQ